MKQRRQQNGFSLIELVVYVGIFMITASLLTGILYTISKIQNKENVESEINQELSFVMQTIQRLVKDSSVVEGTSGVVLSNLTLRRESLSLDPTVITWDANGVYVQQGTAAPATLTSNRVKVSSLDFVKYDNPGGHSVVQIDLVLTYNSNNPNLNISRSLTSAFSRVSAATFDSSLLPDASGTLDVGEPATRWRSASVDRLLNLGVQASDPGEGQAGSIYYNSSAQKVRLHNGTGWVDLGP